MQIDGIIIFDSISGLPLFAHLDESIDSTLFSGFLTAIRQFSSELSLGGLSSFTTEEKTIFLAARSRVVTAIIAPADLEFQKVYSLAYQIGEKFEDTYEIPESPDEEKFKGFSEKLNEIIKKEEVPFLLQAAEFAKKEFGGEVSIRPTLKVREDRGGKTATIDIIVDRGEKKGESFGTRAVKRRWIAFSEDITFIKVVDGVAGRGEVIDFFDSLKGFGDDKDDTTEEYPYFPARAVVVARDYSPTVFEEVEKLTRHKGKAVITGDHITWRARIGSFPDAGKCFIELWKWKEDYPERMFH
ncbi:MAG: hypothetical protein ACFFBD_20030 [Candidatus Hodarchaeota archaeon]